MDFSLVVAISWYDLFSVSAKVYLCHLPSVDMEKTCPYISSTAFPVQFLHDYFFLVYFPGPFPRPNSKHLGVRTSEPSTLCKTEKLCQLVFELLV